MSNYANTGNGLVMLCAYHNIHYRLLVVFETSRNFSPYSHFADAQICHPIPVSAQKVEEIEPPPPSSEYIGNMTRRVLKPDPSPSPENRRAGSPRAVLGEGHGVEDRLAQKTGEAMTPVPARARVAEQTRRQVRQLYGAVELAVQQQPCVGTDRRAAERELH